VVLLLVEVISLVDCAQGLERLAMVIFDIPDIRLFWTEDERFHRFFRGKTADDILKIRFKPYSKYPPCLKDVTFWQSPTFTENSFCALVREIAGDLAEQVQLLDRFQRPSDGRTSLCYRVTYRSMDRSLTNEEIDALQARVRQEVVEKLGVELR
jgi:phenylalanyl-tRNA synthetase alpha chain